MPGTLARLPFSKQFSEPTISGIFPRSTRVACGFFIENAGRTPIRDAAERAAVVGNFDFRPHLAEIRQPVLVVRSEHEGQVLAACSDELETWAAALFDGVAAHDRTACAPGSSTSAGQIGAGLPDRRPRFRQ